MCQQKEKTMSIAIITKKEIKSRVVYNQFLERMETIIVDVITFQSGYTERFDNFVSEVSNSQWCTPAECIAIRKTTSQTKKQEFVNKYADQFVNVPGSGRA